MELHLQEENAEAASLVGSFSLNVVTHRPDDVIATSLCDQELAQRQPRLNQELPEERLWKDFYENAGSARTPAEALLAVECDSLMQAWQDFVPEHQDNRIKGITKLAPSSSKVSMKDLIGVVTNVRDQQKGPGRAHRYLSRFLNTLDSHSQMLGTLPDQSLYGSIFCGVLKSLISASGNHRKIIEALSKDLVEIGEVIESCVLQVQLFCTTEMQGLIRRLYASVFSFLRQAMGWYEDKRRKRLLNSFNENFYESFSDTIEEIRRIGRLIHTKGMIANHAETRDTRIIVEKIREGQRESTADDEYWKRQLKKTEEKYEMLLNLTFRHQIGCYMTDLLVMEGRDIAPLALTFNATRTGIPSEYMQWNERRIFTELDYPSTSATAVRPGNVPQQALQSDLSTRTYLKCDIETDSLTLEEFIHSRLDAFEVYPSSQIFAEHQAVYAIKEWSISIASQILWILSPSDRHYPSNSSKLAAALINSADEAAIPAVHLFLDWPSNERCSIFNALYSLIRQMISLLPQQLTSTTDLSSGQFARLTDQIESWEAGLAVLNELLELAPPLLLVFIDGIDHLDYLSIGTRYVEGLLRQLQRHVWANGEQEPKRTIKILFTTAGNCVALNGLEERDLTVVKITETRLRQRGKANPGLSGVAL